MKTIYGGLSGAKITVDGKYLTKTDINSNSVGKWYELADQRSINIPNVYEVTETHIKMEYLVGPTLHDRWSVISLLLVLEQIFLNIKEKPVDPSFKHGEFRKYIERVLDHMDLDPILRLEIRKVREMMSEIAGFADTQRGFCHGDLNLKNVILSTDITHPRVYLIDPIPMWGVYSSWILDISKLVQSIRFTSTGNDKLVRNFGEYHGVDRRTMDILELSHDIRMLKYLKKHNPEEYRSLSFYIQKTINRLYKWNS